MNKEIEEFLELITPQPGFKVLDVTTHVDDLTQSIADKLEPFVSSRLAIARYEGEHQKILSKTALKIDDISSFSQPFRALPRDNDIVVIRDVLHQHQFAERILKVIYTTLANTGNVIIMTKKGEANTQEQLDMLERAEYRAGNIINIFKEYDLLMAKKMHMWGNGL